MKRLGLVLALLLFSPSFVHAYSLTCGDARLAVASGQLFAGGIVVGHLNGAADVMAGLLCLTGSPKCSCYSALIDSDDFPRFYGQELNSCPSGDPAFGAALRAAKKTCG